MRRSKAPTARWTARGLFLVVLAAAAAGCASDGAPRPIDPALDLHAPDASRRAQAVQHVARSGNTRFVPDLIELLDDRDETVRLQAGVTLRQLTGHDTGYRPFAPRGERLDQVEAWRAWWSSRTPPQPDDSQPAAPQPDGPPPPPPPPGSGS